MTSHFHWSFFFLFMSEISLLSCVSVDIISYIERQIILCPRRANLQYGTNHCVRGVLYPLEYHRRFIVQTGELYYVTQRHSILGGYHHFKWHISIMVTVSRKGITIISFYHIQLVWSFYQQRKVQLLVQSLQDLGQVVSQCGQWLLPNHPMLLWV